MTDVDFNNNMNKTFFGKTSDFMKSNTGNIIKRTVEGIFQPIGALTALSGFKASNVRKNLGLADDAQVTISRRIASYFATLLEKMTFGFAKAQDWGKAMYGVIKIIRDIAKGIGNVIVKVKDGIVNLYERVKSGFTAFTDKIGSWWRGMEEEFEPLKVISDRVVS